MSPLELFDLLVQALDAVGKIGEVRHRSWQADRGPNFVREALRIALSLNALENGASKAHFPLSSPTLLLSCIQILSGTVELIAKAPITPALGGNRQRQTSGWRSSNPLCTDSPSGSEKGLLVIRVGGSVAVRITNTELLVQG
jgi:hypothetical protein